MTFAEKLTEAEEYLIVNDKKLAPYIKLYRPAKLKPHTDYYAELVSSIVGQQLSVAAGTTIWKRVLALFGNKMPTPQELVKISDERLRAAGLSGPKVGYVKDLALHILDGRLDMAHIASLPNNELMLQLTAVKGIGDWSAHMFMIFSLGRLDVLPVGDLGIRKAAMQLYDLPELPDKIALEEIAKDNRWHPYESLASWYLWQSLDNKPTTTRHS
jgi:DNA-3-methyladenine glycosylase II